MSEHHASAIERVLHRIEEHLEDWRKRDAALQAEEAHRESIEELTKQHRVVFVLHRTEVEETLEDFVRAGDRLVSVVPRRGGETISEGLKGSWLVFESSD
jgi:hypothetical protein